MKDQEFANRAWDALRRFGPLLDREVATELRHLAGAGAGSGIYSGIIHGLVDYLAGAGVTVSRADRRELIRLLERERSSLRGSMVDLDPAHWDRKMARAKGLKVRRRRA